VSIVTFELVLSHLRKRDFAVLSTIGIDRRDGRAAEGGDRFHRALLADIPPDHLVDFVDLDGADQQRLAAFD